jgi:predicted short-subunit dehydrogenase-like oxidoreductase (DUF2520 family)
MRIVLVGPGRAGTAVSLAARRAGHEFTAVAGRNADRVAEAAAALAAEPLALTDPLPPSDLLVIAVSDDAISDVAAVVEPALRTEAAVHLSGAVPIAALAALEDRGLAIGSFHPLQTLPTPEAGAQRIPGAWIAVTVADRWLGDRLHDLATSLGARPFDLTDDVKPLYHAAAAAAANFTLVSLTMAQDLFAEAGVPRQAAAPLVDAVVANAFALGAREALTGPIARGDVETVRRQVAAVEARAPDWAPTFRVLVAETAAVAGRGDTFAEILE